MSQTCSKHLYRCCFYDVIVKTKFYNVVIFDTMSLWPNDRACLRRWTTCTQMAWTTRYTRTARTVYTPTCRHRTASPNPAPRRPDSTRAWPGPELLRANARTVSLRTSGRLWIMCGGSGCFRRSLRRNTCAPFCWRTSSYASGALTRLLIFLLAMTKHPRLQIIWRVLGSPQCEIYVCI